MHHSQLRDEPLKPEAAPAPASGISNEGPATDDGSTGDASSPDRPISTPTAASGRGHERPHGKPAAQPDDPAGTATDDDWMPL